MDIDIPEGEKIFALNDGIIISARNSKTYGNFVVYKTIDDYEITCGHLSKIFVKENSTIKKNDIVGLSGNTGLSTGPHLHFAIKYNNAFLDPRYLIILE
ncbi:MAG: M23 family metallopeptidase [Clostridiales bacterium]|nr:M23 family metallopeptidase [Clostridiales bacterium]